MAKPSNDRRNKSTFIAHPTKVDSRGRPLSIYARGQNPNSGQSNLPADEYLKRFNEKHEGKNVKLVSDYISTKDPVKVLFENCGHTFEFKQPFHVSTKEIGEQEKCPTCEMAKPRGARVTFADFLERAKEKHGDSFLYDEDSYIKMDKPMKIFCVKHKKWFEQWPEVHARPSSVTECCCPLCLKEYKDLQNDKKCKETFREKLKEERPNLKAITEFISWNDPITLECDCGHIQVHEGTKGNSLWSSIFETAIGCRGCSGMLKWTAEEDEKLWLPITSVELAGWPKGTPDGTDPSFVPDPNRPPIDQSKLHPDRLINRTYGAIKGRRQELGIKVKDLTKMSPEQRDENNKISHQKYYQKKKQDPVWLFSQRIRGLTQKAFLLNGLKKADTKLKTEEILGISPEKFREYILNHIEFDSEHGMTEENYGTVWEIDHDTPISWSEGDMDKVIELSHYTNLQPAWVTTAIAQAHGVYDRIGNRDKRNFQEGVLL